ncbi:MAG TPA: NAD(P)H-hydrate dehydratase [Candidatus Omnitrophota bacterium]|nr:NAD(P)H-hydrate dehydratase [Candidatus Omnitrophota bacterium]
MTNFPLLPRKKTADKSAYGRVLVLAGSERMPGAAVLASSAALRSGAGLVTLASPKALKKAFVRIPHEIMRLPLASTARGTVTAGAFADILRYIQKRRINSLAVGPGLTEEPGPAACVRRIILSVSVTTVLDADGLNAFKGKTSLLKNHAGPLILTPHHGEFKRLFGEEMPQNGKARLTLAKRLSKFYDVVLVLKGHRTLVVDGDRAYVNHTGNPGLAKGGSGDVLTGIIASFVAQGLDPYEAARWAVYFHGRAADIAVKRTGELGLTASDVIEALPKAFGR